jgi:hypothetical protein
VSLKQHQQQQEQEVVSARQCCKVGHGTQNNKLDVLQRDLNYTTNGMADNSMSWLTGSSFSV